MTSATRETVIISRLPYVACCFTIEAFHVAFTKFFIRFACRLSVCHRRRFLAVFTFSVFHATTTATTPRLPARSVSRSPAPACRVSRSFRSSKAVAVRLSRSPVNFQAVSARHTRRLLTPPPTTRFVAWLSVAFAAYRSTVSAFSSGHSHIMPTSSICPPALHYRADRHDIMVLAHFITPVRYLSLPRFPMLTSTAPPLFSVHVPSRR